MAWFDRMEECSVHVVRFLGLCWVSMLFCVSAFFPSGSVIKNSPANVGDMGLIPGLGRSSGEGHDNGLQYSCLENPMDRAAWWATVHEVSKELDRT